MDMLETQDFFELMYAYKHERGSHAIDCFEAVKAFIRLHFVERPNASPDK